MNSGKNKMITTSCPLRISLLGGSTDLEDFIDYYGYGEVISFPINLYTYVSINKRYDGKFLIQYSKTENVNKISEIKNELVRTVLEYFKITTPITVALNADIPSHGSGLASSSSFIIALIKAVSVFKDLELSDYEVCKIALQLERKFNPLVGRQDAYGCGIKGFKHLYFEPNKEIKTTFFSNTYFNNFDLFLIPISKNGRKSTKILQSLQLKERKTICDNVKYGVKYLESKNFKDFNNLILDTWESKKKTSPLIITPKVLELETKIKSIKYPLYYKLCGAGGGGYLLLIKQKTDNISKFGILEENSYINIKVDNRGIKTWQLN
jgi:D-glycero-alpha-D-manno-heptose-7-phosphate kinase